MNVGAMAAVTIAIFAEKMLPWPRLGRACPLWCAGDYVTPTPSYLPARWRRGGARKNADDVAREVADPIFNAGSPMSAYGPKRTLAVRRNLWWIWTVTNDHRPRLCLQASVAERLIVLPPAKQGAPLWSAMARVISKAWRTV